MGELSATCIPDHGEFLLGDWRVSQTEGILAMDSLLIRLEPRVMDVLVYLATSPGRVVSKEELLDAVWNGTFVEEGVLSQAIHSLRKALGDDARNPRYIQTIPKRGYRLVAVVAPAGDLKPVEELPLLTVELEPERVTLEQPFVFHRQARLFLLILIVLAAAISWIAWNRFKARPIRIIVLPFENLGRPAEDDRFFTDGLTEEITNSLASIPPLQVISRSTAIQYRGTRKTVPEIGRELEVDYVLGGTVRWENNANGYAEVRIITRLSRVSDDTHLPGPVLEQRVDDIFEVQEKISRQVIQQMNIALRQGEEQALKKRPTENLDSYRAYVRGLELRDQPFYSEEHLYLAIPLFERAVKLDPGFAEAWAELSQTHSYLAFNSDPSPVRIEQARQALERAMDIAPDLVEVRLARAYYTYRCLDDYAAAERQLLETAERFPNNAVVLESLGLVQRRRGHLSEAIESFELARNVNPREVRLPWWIGETYRAMREYARADKYLEQAVNTAPDQAVYWYERALNQLAWTGDPDLVRKLISESPVADDSTLAIAAFQLDLYQGEYERALRRLTPEVMKETAPQVAGRVAVLSVSARERLGDWSGALAAAEINRRLLQERVTRFPKDNFCRAYLAVALAQLGREAQALAQADEAVRRANGDAFSGPRIAEARAMVYARLGRASKAIAELEHLSDTQYQASISAPDLKFNPIWEPLRRKEKFMELLKRVGD
jgi:DNA-binding winged helix-turn-helix (wHTH) protein/TolB-like protein